MTPGWPITGRSLRRLPKGRSPCASCFPIRRGYLSLIKPRRWTMCRTRPSSRRCSRLRRPLGPPVVRHGYHAVTLGWYESELIRHADPAGRSLGRFFADEVATPLGLDFHIGLPASVDRDRVAHLHCWSHAETVLHLNALPMRFVAARFNPRSLTSRAVTIPKGLPR